MTNRKQCCFKGTEESNFELRGLDSKPEPCNVISNGSSRSVRINRAPLRRIQNGRLTTRAALS